MNSQPRVLTITIQYPGLGDQLFWSHIPRIAKDKATRGGAMIKSMCACATPLEIPNTSNSSGKTIPMLIR